MSDDIVIRLRDTAYETELCWEAAGEIERLQERTLFWRKLAGGMANCLDSSTEAGDLLAVYEKAVRHDES